MTWDKILKLIAGGAGAIIGLLGGWNVVIQVLVALMAVDYVTGVALAALGRSGKTEGGGLSSKAGLVGLVKKGFVLAVVLLAAQVDRLTGTQAARDAVCLFFVANEGLSILENAVALGVPVPAPLKRALEQLKPDKATEYLGEPPMGELPVDEAGQEGVKRGEA